MTTTTDAHAPPAAPRPTPSERIERSPAGRALLSVLVLAILGGIAVWNLPHSELRARLVPVVEPYMHAAGLDQDWGVFAPDPRRITLELQARITYDDGTTETWLVPHGGRLLGAYRFYRWRKWIEYARGDAYEHLWRPTAEWVAREHATGARTPVEVVLVRRWYDIPPPGSGREPTPWNEFEYFTLEVTPEVLG